MKLDILTCAAIVWISKCIKGDGTILKCITQERDTIRMKCPRRYVIFNPSIVAAVSRNNTCSRDSAYCTGLPRTLMEQINNCHWRKHCNITFQRNDSLYCGHQSNVSEERITFVEIVQPYCIPRGSIIDTQSKPAILIKTKQGVVRSHKRYPTPKRKSPQSRRITIKIRRSHTLYVNPQRPSECSGKKDVTLRRVKNGRRSLVRSAFQKKLIFHGNDTDSLELTVKQTDRDDACLGGFILPFSSYRTESIDELLEWPKSSFSVIRDLEWIFEVRAVIEHCTVDSTGKAILMCDNDDVIYSPEFSVAGYTRYQPACIFGKYPCGSHTPMTLVQRNSCFWKSVCPVTWNGQIPILASRVTSCIGFAASVLGLYGHRCVPKEQVFDMCSNCSKTITSDWGIIRSHSTYPWFFGADLKYSKRIIQIGGGNKLLLVVQDINLDPDGRDKFTLVHSFIESTSAAGPESPVIKQERRIVMKTKAARSGVMVEVSGGTLDVIFQPYRSTKGGRGFVLVFKKYKIDKPQILSDVQGQPKDTGLISDAEKPILLRLNRRRCSSDKNGRLRGRACRPRVWTDFFTKLE